VVAVNKSSGSDEAAAIRVAVTNLYAPYKRTDFKGYERDLTPWTRRTRDLIQRWRGGRPLGAVTPMGNFDWLCQCQDWDAKTFALTSVVPRRGEKGVYGVDIAYSQGLGGGNRLALDMLFEDGRWRVDDIRFQDGRSLRASLAGEMGLGSGPVGGQLSPTASSRR
jgi:hypothetical protein